MEGLHAANTRPSCVIHGTNFLGEGSSRTCEDISLLLDHQDVVTMYRMITSEASPFWRGRGETLTSPLKHLAANLLNELSCCKAAGIDILTFL